MRSNVMLSGLIAICMCSFASPATASLIIKIDKSAQTLTVTNDGKTLHRWPVSTGTTRYATPSGTFMPIRMEEDHYSREWDDAPMPHSLFFTKQGHAIHGSHHVRRLGTPASHGCVRLAPTNAARLFGLAKKNGLSNTKIVLTGSEQVALSRGKEARIAGARPPSRGQGRPPGNDRRFFSQPDYLADGGQPFYRIWR